MYCPRCGQEQLKQNTKFCSRCRFLMTGFDAVVKKGGLPKEVLFQQNPNAISPRRSGLKQGALIFLSGILIVPLLAILTEMINAQEEIVAIAAILTFVAGIVRMVYALFQSGTPTEENTGIVDSLKSDLIGRKVNEKALPPQQTEPFSINFDQPAGNWRETADLEASAVSEKETKTLHNKTFQ